jgi:hypothetical protein
MSNIYGEATRACWSGSFYKQKELFPSKINFEDARKGHSFDLLLEGSIAALSLMQPFTVRAFGLLLNQRQLPRAILRQQNSKSLRGKNGLLGRRKKDEKGQNGC